MSNFQYTRPRTVSQTYRSVPPMMMMHAGSRTPQRPKHTRTRSLPAKHQRSRSTNGGWQLYSIPPDQMARERERSKRSPIVKPKSPPKISRVRSLSTDSSNRLRRSPPSKSEEKSDITPKRGGGVSLIHKIGGRFENEVWLAQMGDQIIVAKRTKTTHQYAKDDHEIESIILDFRYPLFIGKIFAYQDLQFSYILMEHATTTLKRKMEREPISPLAAKMIVAQLLEAMAYLHDQGIAYLNLCPRHILFKNNDSLEPKLIDFQTALKVKDDSRYDTFVGLDMTAYLAPERFRQRLGWELKLSDVWAVGVIAFQMYTSRLPFAGANQEQTITKIVNRRFRWPKRMEIQCNFKDFIEAIFSSSRKRPSAVAALELEWITDGIADNNGGDTLSPLASIGEEDDVPSLASASPSSSLSSSSFGKEYQTFPSTFSRKTPRQHKRSATYFK